MGRILKFNQLLEYKTVRKKLKTKWTRNDAILTLYYEKFGLDRLGYQGRDEEFANVYIGSTAGSLKMQTQNIRFITSNKGLPDYSNFQEEAVAKYDKFSEPELRKIVNEILDNMPEEEKAENYRRATEAKKEDEKKKREKEKAERKKKSEEYNKQRLINFKTDEEISVKVGDILDHKNFGEGEVISVDGNLIKIDFIDGGIKRIIFDPEKFNW